MPVSLIKHDWDHYYTRSPFAHLVFADPPYNQQVSYADDPTWDRLAPDEYEHRTTKWIMHINHLLLPGGTFWWMTPEKHADWTGQLLTSLVGPRVYRIVWHETFAQYQGDRALTMDYRFIFVHRKLPDSGGGLILPRWNPHAIRVKSTRQEMGDKRANPDGRVPGCVWKVRRLQGTSADRVDWHPTQLAPEMMDRIVLGWSNPGDHVVDAFVGSGVMAQAAVRHGREFTGFDRSQTYLDKVAERVNRGSVKCENA